jgi:hypothetical protein
MKGHKSLKKNLVVIIRKHKHDSGDDTLTPIISMNRTVALAHYWNYE